jgi:hypothetical protein
VLALFYGALSAIYIVRARRRLAGSTSD